MSQALPAKRALIDTISRHDTFRNRQVCLSHPGQHMEMECVFIVGVAATEQGRAIGKAYRREVLDISVGILAEVSGDDYEDAEERAWVMFGAIEEVIATDPSLGGLCHFAEITSFDQRAYTGDQIRACEITTVVSVTASKDPAS